MQTVQHTVHTAIVSAVAVVALLQDEVNKIDSDLKKKNFFKCTKE